MTFLGSILEPAFLAGICLQGCISLRYHGKYVSIETVFFKRKVNRLMTIMNVESKPNQIKVLPWIYEL